MIKANELRLGNYVDAVGIGVAEITNLDNETKYKNLLPVDMTEFWSVKFGYECMVEMASDFTFESKYEVEITAKDLEVLKVHEVQNLYFALTSKELVLSEA